MDPDNHYPDSKEENKSSCSKPIPFQFDLKTSTNASSISMDSFSPTVSPSASSPLYYPSLSSSPFRSRGSTPFGTPPSYSSSRHTPYPSIASFMLRKKANDDTEIDDILNRLRGVNVQRSNATLSPAQSPSVSTSKFTFADPFQTDLQTTPTQSKPIPIRQRTQSFDELPFGAMEFEMDTQDPSTPVVPLLIPFGSADEDGSVKSSFTTPWGSFNAANPKALAQLLHPSLSSSSSSSSASSFTNPTTTSGFINTNQRQNS